MSPQVIAEDAHAARLKLVTENALRLGTTCVEVHPSEAPSTIPTRFDRVLVDAPCSNTGVLRRRVELRWRLQPGELLRLPELQLEILRATGPRVRPGGILVYSTCSLEPEENAAVLKTWLATQNDFSLEDERELWPWRDGTDGAFVAKLRRVNG